VRLKSVEGYAVDKTIIFSCGVRRQTVFRAKPLDVIEPESGAALRLSPHFRARP
jgi:hypothetical protein